MEVGHAVGPRKILIVKVDDDVVISYESPFLPVCLLSSYQFCVVLPQLIIFMNISWLILSI